MFEQMLSFLVSVFSQPTAWGIGLAVLFGAALLAAYWPRPLFEKYRWRQSVSLFFMVLIGSAILTWIAIAFIQIPLQNWAGQALASFWDQETLVSWLLLAGLPSMLLTGLVQEGAKLAPVAAYWWREDKNVDPKLGLIIGAVAGAGFGILEAQWIHNAIFTSGWGWEVVEANGILALAGFWERFFVVAFHIASCALAGWGLAKGWGWQFYLIAAGLHAFINYSALFLYAGLMTAERVEIFIAALALLVTYAALWLRWRKSLVAPKAEAEVQVEPESGVET